MSEFDEFLEVINTLNKNLKIFEENEKIFCHDICLELERYSWELYRMENEINKLKEIYGG